LIDSTVLIKMYNKVGLTLSQIQKEKAFRNKTGIALKLNASQ